MPLNAEFARAEPPTEEALGRRVRGGVRPSASVAARAPGKGAAATGQEAIGSEDRAGCGAGTSAASTAVSKASRRRSSRR